MNLLRLRTYNTNLGNFDFLDKELIGFKNFYFLNSVALMSQAWIKQDSVEIPLKQILITEFFNNQKIKLVTYENNSKGLSNFISDFDRKNKNLFLDYCLNSIFLVESNLKLNQIDLIQNLYFCVPNKIVDYFSLSTTNFRLSISLSSELLRNNNSIKSFYFVSDSAGE